MCTKQKLLSKSIGFTLKSWLEANSITQAQVAVELGTSAAYVNGLCNGSKSIGKGMAKKLHDIYGLSESFLLTGNGTITEPFPVMSTEDFKKFQIFQQAIQKANRIRETLLYLKDEGYIENILDIAPIIGALTSVVDQTMKYDPNGRYDFVILRICEHYPQISLEWLLLGEGQMVHNSESLDVALAIKELKEARDEFRDATYRITQFISNHVFDDHRSIAMVSDNPDDKPTLV